MVEAAARDAFRLTADPAFFWRHGQYARAFDALRAAVLAGERFVLLTGDAGTGKTTLVNALGQSLGDDGLFVGRLMYGRIEAAEMWSAVALALSLEGLDSREAFTNGAPAAFVRVCAGARAAVLIVDEAQTLAPGALVELERLTDVLSRGDRPVLSVLLVGLSEVNPLASAECADLVKRIATRVKVADLSAAEVASYIRHRLEIAGANPELLPAKVIAHIATASGGTPAVINEMCRSFVAGFEDMREPVTALRPGRRWPLRRIGLVVAGVAGLGMTILAGVHYRNAAPPPAAVLTPVEPVAASVDATPPPAVEQPVASPPAPPSGGGELVPGRPPQAVPADTQRSSRTMRATTPGAGKAPAATATQSAVTQPRRQGDEPDPSDVIDWLLKEAPQKR